MQHSLRKGFQHCFVFCLATIFSSSLASGGETDRLATLGEIWFNVEYLHPRLAYDDASWDKALGAAIPAVKKASSSEEFAGAIGAMLATLGDPMTHVTLAPTPASLSPGDGTLLRIEQQSDGVVIVTLNSEGPPPSWGAVRSEFRRLQVTFLEAESVIVDLRMRAADDYRRWLLLSHFDSIAPALLDSTLDGPGFRSRLHKGWPTSIDSSSGGMYSALLTKAGHRFRAERDAKIPIAFVFDRWSPVPSVAAALHAAGRASVVFVGEGQWPDGSESLRIPIEDNWEAVIRLDEMILPDGSALPEPTARVEEKDAVDRALQYVRNPVPLTVSPECKTSCTFVARKYNQASIGVRRPLPIAG